MKPEMTEPMVANIETAEWKHEQNDFGQPESYQDLFLDPDTGFFAQRFHDPAGTSLKLHTHSCGHGVYVLSGTFVANGKKYGPGTMLWFKQGTWMEHGAPEDESCDFLYFWPGVSIQRPFDIDYPSES